MISSDVLVVDATVHAFNFRLSNLKAPFMIDVVRMLHQFTMHSIHPQGDQRYYLSFEEFQDAFQHQPALLEQALFGESATDVAVYHGVPMYGLFGDGSSPVHIVRELKKKLPHRVHVYGDVSPWMDDPIGRVDRMIDEEQAIGLKFYPLDMVEGRLKPIDLRDEDHVIPIIEHARKRGLKVIAVHKAVPLGATMPRPAYHVDDMASVVEAFPDMTFEIVHGGFAFAEETAALLARYPNVTVNLETNPCFAINDAARFAEMMEPLLRSGAWDRIFYATGATGSHPRPTAEAFWAYRAPYGYTPMTEEMKRGILGLNFARQHGWDVEAVKNACRSDPYGLEDKAIGEPWELIKRLRTKAA